MFFEAMGLFNQPFQACDPINKQTEGPWPTDCTTSLMRQLSSMYKAEKNN